MQDESQQQSDQQPQEGQQEEKKERIDELDVVGGLILKMLSGIGNFIKGIFIPKKVE